MQDNTQPQVPAADPMAAPVVTTPAPAQVGPDPVVMPVENVVTTDVKVELPGTPEVSTEAPVTAAPTL